MSGPLHNPVDPACPCLSCMADPLGRQERSAVSRLAHNPALFDPYGPLPGERGKTPPMETLPTMDGTLHNPRDARCECLTCVTNRSYRPGLDAVSLSSPQKPAGPPLLLPSGQSDPRQGHEERRAPPAPADPGVRFDGGKFRFDLLPMGPITELVNVLGYGSRKYQDDNWRKGLPYKATWGAMIRHAVKWYAGEQIDEESGCRHLAMVMWNAMVLLEFEMQGRTDLDDRPKGAPLPPINTTQPPISMKSQGIK